MIDTMFGFIWKQPIHKTLRQMRVVSSGFAAGCMWLLFDIWLTMKARIVTGEGDAWVGGVGALALALVTGMFAVIKNFSDPHKEDD